MNVNNVPTPCAKLPEQRSERRKRMATAKGTITSMMNSDGKNTTISSRDAQAQSAVGRIANTLIPTKDINRVAKTSRAKKDDF